MVGELNLRGSCGTSARATILPMLMEVRAAEPFYKNGFVLGCDETREGVLVDPGDEVGELLEIVSRERLDIKYILLTHAHMDHISGVGRAKEALGAPIGLHRDDHFLYRAAVQQGLAFGFHLDPPPPVDFFYEGRGPYGFGRYEALVHHTPGHCPGGVCLQIGRAGEPGRLLLVGDTLFAGSIGRTDLPGGDLDTLLRSIRTVLFAFGDDAQVFPGHGPATTIGRERATNPFLT
jgi:glyoxylase-like metal-dependent hydrolase (beta-lactamase superfamily II)